MEKRTMSSYGWITIIILISCLLISMATPFGKYVKDSALNATESFVNLALDTLGLERKLRDGSDYFYVDDLGILYTKPLYQNELFGSVNDILYEQNGLSKKEAKEFLAYSLLSEDNVGVGEWKELAISNAKLKNIARNSVLQNYPFANNILSEYSTNPNCTSIKQAVLNIYYDKTVAYLGFSTVRTANSNITEDALNNIWRTWAGSARPQIVEQLSDIHSNREIALNTMVLKTLITEDNIHWPEPDKINKGYVYEECKRFTIPKIYVDCAYLIYNNILSKPDTLEFKDMMGYLRPELTLFNIDELSSLEDENSGADVNKAFAFIANGMTLDEFMELVNSPPILPSSFEIPEEINDVRVIAVTDNSGFQENKNIVEIRLPESLYIISDDSFQDCVSLQKINLNNVHAMGFGAFRGCKSLKRVELSPQLKEIFYTTFNDCIELEEVIAGEGLETIYSQSFENCTSLKKIVIPGDVDTVFGDPFYCSSDRLVIYSTEGGYMQRFAETYGYAFVVI